jgi:Mycothiol maleylpyruvate isomerase N-terminal domain
MNKQDIINELNDEYRSLLELVQDFGKDDFEKPGAAGLWTARDVFAHLAFWNGEAKKAIALALRGERPDPWLAANVDQINAREAAARRSTALYKVMDDFRRSVRELVAQLEAASERLLERETVHQSPEGSNANAAWVALSLNEHLRTHGEEMDIWLHAES